jgi:gamma-glutamyltranspeptidase/glutathione hydrolase
MAFSTKTISPLIALLVASCSFIHNTKHSPPIQASVEKKHKTHVATSIKAAVATQGQHSTQAALDILQEGGNIIDAAIAASFAISVERPQSTGLGGGGFMLFHLKGMSTPIAIDFREMAPATAHKDMFLDHEKNVIPDKSLVGGPSVGIPGLVAGLCAVHERYGKLPWSRLLVPAIELAQKGIEVYPELEEAIEEMQPHLKKFSSSKRIFLKDNGMPYRQGELLIQTDLANTLKQIAQKGRDAFYSGTIAQAIASSIQQYGGKMNTRDLEDYQVRWRRPVEGTFQGHRIFSMSPPSSGGVHILQILNLVEQYPLRSWGPWDARSVNVTASAMQAAFADRAAYLGDPDFVDVPVKGLTDKAYARDLFNSIKEDKALRMSDRKAGNPFPYESDQTTHFSIIDNEGNMVASTQTINGHFGSALVADGTGIVLNNEMDDFATKVGASNLFGAVGGEKNLVAPGKRPLSSMSPTLVFQGKRPVMALGTPSGTRILTCVAQTLINRLAYDLPLEQAVGMVRFHHQWSPDELHVEDGAPSDVVNQLKKMGHNVVNHDLGCRIQAVEKMEKNVVAVSDSRGEGKAGGL